MVVRIVDWNSKGKPEYKQAGTYWVLAKVVTSSFGTVAYSTEETWFEA